MVGVRGHYGREPDSVHSEVGIRFRISVVEVIELFYNTFQVADTVIVAVVKRADEYFVVVPVVVGGFLYLYALCRVFIPG
jgi:hypothetical protein